MIRHPARRERGVALIAIVALITIGAVGFLLEAIQAASAQRVAKERHHNAAVLALAKQAILGWAAQNALDDSDHNPGRLPCPEAAGYIGNPDQEGIMNPFCGSGTKIGRLPWRSLGLDKLRDAAGEPLWYVISDGWKLTTGGPSDVLGINPNKTGQLTLDGRVVVALIIAPGPPIQVNPDPSQLAAGCVARIQNRRATPPDYRDYLECSNATYPADSSFVTTVVNNASNPVLNDQVVAITSDEVMAAIEGPVAQRIERDVVPELKSVYASAQWGATASAPIFPFAAAFVDTFDPANAGYLAFKGAAGATQGLLPLLASTNCGQLPPSQCDSTFVRWNPASVTAVQTGGTATTFTADCSLSTATQISCNVTYSRLLCILCSIHADVRVRANGLNVGMALRTLDPSVASGLTTLTAPIQPDGSALATYTGTLLGGTGLGWCGSLIGIACTGSATITIPITAFKDHRLLSPTAGDKWYWFIVNRWYYATFYAIAPSHAPSGSHDCGSAGDCLSIAGGSPASNVRATLVLAGRSLRAMLRPNADLTDFLDTAQNRDGDTAFEQKTIRSDFNDRFVVVSSF